MKIQNGIYYDLDNPLQSPFRQQDLLTASGFVSFCEENDIETSEKSLNFFEREGLLLPTLRVDRGYVMFRKILADFEGKEEWRFVPHDKLDEFKYKELAQETFYTLGGVWLKRLDSFEYHFNNGMIIYPSEIGWQETYDLLSTGENFVTNPKDLGDSTEPLYMPHQIFAVEYLHQSFNHHLIDGLHFILKDWGKVKEKVFEGYTSEMQFKFKEQISKQYNFFTFYLFVLQTFENKSMEYLKDIEKAQGDKDEIRAVYLNLAHEKDDNLKKALLSHMKAFNLTSEDVKEWRERFFISGSFWNMPSKRKELYLTKLTEDDLYKTEYVYWIIRVLNWLLEHLGNRQVTINELILRGKICPYCKKPFNPTKKTQVACFSKECQNEHKKKLKREGYKSGWYQKPLKKAKRVELK